ncbi:MAG: hypothetical protein ACK5KN_13240 [Dysgonomonas sp.]|uniref:hypothetical protein n=1 Tax=Dysgonomonas sp. TaxID=1891233 RepID=UPI003A8C1439
MITLKTLTRLYPKYQLSESKNIVVISENEANAKIKGLSIKNADFLSLDTTIVKDFTSFFQKAQSPDLFNLDCDGVILFENDGIKYVLLVELKSKFSTTEIFKARRQIISSFIKLNILFNSLENYDKNNYCFKGVIVSLLPNDEALNAISKKIMLDDAGGKYAKFAFSLYTAKNFNLSSNSCNELSSLPFHSNCIFKDVTFQYVGVEEGKASVDIDVNMLM